jgi:hypothetical protein
MYILDLRALNSTRSFHDKIDIQHDGVGGLGCLALMCSFYIYLIVIRYRLRIHDLLLHLKALPIVNFRSQVRCEATRHYKRGAQHRCRRHWIELSILIVHRETSKLGKVGLASERKTSVHELT